MFKYDASKSMLIGPQGSLPIPPDDQAALKLIMLLQGECTEIGPGQAAKEFDYSKSRYYQIREAFAQKGLEGLITHKTGPKGNYRRTSEVSKLVIRARFLDPEASAEVIASKLRQDGYRIATRSVERIIHEYGLQKKTPSSVSRPRASRGRNATHKGAASR
jgi:transposase